MKVVLYNINSFGGNYEYSKYLHAAYKENGDVVDSKMLMPANAAAAGAGIEKILFSDIPSFRFSIYRKLHFLFRSLLNPWILFFYLKKQESSFVIFNDFDQTTAWFWAPLFRLLKGKHTFAVILHDPDRDAFFKIRRLSESSMSAVMSFMDIAFYHGFLPDKVYYRGNFDKVQVPHGIYDDTALSSEFLEEIKRQSQGSRLISILGNIRNEKNYEFAIDALTELGDVKLLVAGKAANSDVSIEYYLDYARKKEVFHKIIWINEYLDQARFNAAIAASDLVLLYYKPSFTSQSGVLNTIAPFSRKLIISDVNSSLRDTVAKYGLGQIVEAENGNALVAAIRSVLSGAAPLSNWETYMKESSWEKHVSIAINSYNQKRNER